MPTIITPSYFEKGDLKIPNAITLNAGEGVNGDLQAIIEKYERELLLAALGKTQYDELQAALLLDPFVSGGGGPAAQKWIDFVNGSGEWKGIKPILGNYIYCHWLRFDEINYSTVGAGKKKAKAHVIADLNQKYTERWNEFVIWWQEGYLDETALVDFLRETNGLSADKFRWQEFENSFGL